MKFKALIDIKADDVLTFFDMPGDSILVEVSRGGTVIWHRNIQFGEGKIRVIEPAQREPKFTFTHRPIPDKYLNF